MLATTLRCAALNAGDVMVVGYSTTNPDSVSFVTWVELAANETITITDRKYQGDGDGSGEGTGGGTYASNKQMVWTNTSGSPVGPGTVIRVTDNDSSSTLGVASIGSASGDLTLTNQGEHIFLMQGTFNGSGNLIGDLLFGVDFDNNVGWEPLLGESALPGALNVANGNLSFGSETTREYTGARSGSALGAYPALIADTANWSAAGDPLSVEAFVGTTTQPNYSPGDLVFLGWNANDPDTMSFVTWVDIPNGESFLFFDFQRRVDSNCTHELQDKSSIKHDLFKGSRYK